MQAIVRLVLPGGSLKKVARCQKLIIIIVAYYLSSSPIFALVLYPPTALLALLKALVFFNF